MGAIEERASAPGQTGLGAEAFWDGVVERVAGFLIEHGVDARETVVLLPFVQHISLAQTAWAARPAAGWMPRFETTQTLARTAIPLNGAPVGALSFDGTADALEARRLLRAHLPQNWQADRSRFDHVVTQVVETAQALAGAWQAVPPAQRTAWADTARAALAPGVAGAPGAMERALARLALEWAQTAPTEAADALHALRPAAWVALRAGARDPLVEAVMRLAPCPVLWIDAEVSMADVMSARRELSVATCDDFEDEAQRAAARVLAHVERGETPVALIALDRVLLRRVRALLERQRVALADETGWRLSTTRAGAAVTGLLRAARRGATTDDVLDWLTSALAAPAGLSALEANWRRHQTAVVRQVDPASLPPAALALWQRWQAIAEPLIELHADRVARLGDWLAALGEALRRAQLWEPFSADAAGAQVIAALHADATPPSGGAWAHHLRATLFDSPDFSAWVEAVLEAAPFRPMLETASEASVFITPLARAMLRPFAAVVCPGADAQRLGAMPPPQPLLGDATARSLGLPGAQQRLEAEHLAFMQLLRAPRLTLLWRRADGAEPLQPSAWLLALQWAGERAGRPCTAAADERLSSEIRTQELPRPMPTAPALLPSRLSATTYEALRACPYRFFALHALRLDEAEELDDALDKRDYGTWLHDVLHDFHTQRDAARPMDDDPLLRRIALDHQALQARDDADFLPYAASFEELLPRYLLWLHAEEAQGLRVDHTELALEAKPARLAADGPGLRGRLDRVDTVGRGAARHQRIVDYKTSSASALQARVREPFEDTQLAFYAALLSAAEPDDRAKIEASYLALDGRDGVKLVSHPQVEASAAALIEGVAIDFERLRSGAALPALGEGSACEHCEARGLCRRDHWTQAAT